MAILIATGSTFASVTMRFKVKIEYDNCSPTGYTGNYAVKCDIYGGGNLLCTGYELNLQNGSSEQTVDFECDIPINEYLCTYSLTITIYRYPSGTCSTPNYFNGYVCWAWLTDGTHVFNIHLS